MVMDEPILSDGLATPTLSQGAFKFISARPIEHRQQALKCNTKQNVAEKKAA